MILKFRFLVFYSILLFLFIGRLSCYAGEVVVSMVESSSYYISSKYGADGLHPKNLVVEKSKFGGWLSDVDKWEKCWVDFHLSGKMEVKGVEILSGFIEKDHDNKRDDYYFHLRPHRIQIIPDGSDEKSVFVDLIDSKDKQIVPLNFKDKLTKIRLVVHSVYRKSPVSNIVPYEVVGFRHVRWF